MYYRDMPMQGSKLYFTAPEEGKRLFNGYYKRIYRLFEERGAHHVDDSITAPYDMDLAHRLEIGDQDTYASLYHHHLTCIKQAEITVFECSFASTALGVLIEKALELGKSTIGLYFDSNRPNFVMAIDNPKFILKSYDDETLPAVINESIGLIKNTMDRRFNFFISPDLLEYVKSQAQARGITKSAFIRDLILHHKRGRVSE